MMGKVIVVVKAILTRIIFGTHGFIAIWRVTMIKNDPYYWYLTASIFALCFEGVFTLTIKKNQEWKWFCPSVFFYLLSVCPAIWLIEVDKFDERLAIKAGVIRNVTRNQKMDKNLEEQLSSLEKFGITLPVPEIDAEAWATVIEQLLMLILIIGRWMLPKGGLTRDQLSQLLLVYIGTAADIIEFFDSFKDEKISSNRVLCLMILSIWSWSLLQFTFVLTATKARRTRLTGGTPEPDLPKATVKNGIVKIKEVCCSIDVWAILINIILQDAPFLIFRMLLITYYKIISYMNIFFTCKNTLVIILQFYRLFVVQVEKNKEIKKVTEQMKKGVSGNLAKLVNAATFLGGASKHNKGQVSRPGEKGNKGGNVPSSSGIGGSKGSKGSSSNLPNGKKKKKQRSHESISSQSVVPSLVAKSEPAKDRRLKGRTRRKSLSTSNLYAKANSSRKRDDFFEENEVEDELERIASGSGTIDIDQDSQDVSDVELGIVGEDGSINSIVPMKGKRKNLRMSEDPGIYKISGRSQSSIASSEKSHRDKRRQDTGYSSSSKDSGSSSQRGRTPSSRSGRSSSTGAHRLVNSRGISQNNRRRQLMNKRLQESFDHMIEIEDDEDLPKLSYAEEERI